MTVSMDQFREVFNLYAEQFAKIPMFPVLQCVHYTVMTLKLRMAEGKGVEIHFLCVTYRPVITRPGKEFKIYFF